MQATGELNATAKTYIEQLQFSRALESLWELFQLCDQYIEKNAPWKLAKKPEDRPKLEKVLFNVAYSMAFSIPFLYPFMPNTAYEMARQLGLKPEFRNRKLEFNRFTAGIEIAKGTPLFPRIITATGSLAFQGAEPKLIKGETRVNEQPTLQPASPTSTSTTPTPATAISPPSITIDDFMKIQLKTATVLSAERVPNSEKLIKLQVDLGNEKRQIVAGIGKKYEPDALMGKRIVIVANLQPRKLMGIESQGMVLAAGEANVEGLITVLEDVAPGMKVK